MYAALLIGLIGTVYGAVVMDDDWVLELTYPFPPGICIQASPDFALGGFVPYWVYYECSDDGTYITKYKWDSDTDNDECDLSITASNITIFDGSVTSRCEVGYFECDGTTSYIEFSAFGGFGDDCDSASIELVNPGYISTGECFCYEAEGIYSQFSLYIHIYIHINNIFAKSHYILFKIYILYTDLSVIV